MISMGYVGFVRRRMRREGMRITVRWGRVYTMGARTGRQPDSEAQMRARGILARASEAAKREMEDEARRLYWTEHAAEMGYRTARGACVAHHVRLLREMPTEEAVAALGRDVRRKRMEEMRRLREEMRRTQGERKPLYAKVKGLRGRTRQGMEMLRAVDEAVRMVKTAMAGPDGS